MNNLLNIKTPAQDQAKAHKADYGLDNHGLTNLNTVYWNLPTEALVEEIVISRRSTGCASGSGDRQYRKTHRTLRQR